MWANRSTLRKTLDWVGQMMKYSIQYFNFLTLIITVMNFVIINSSTMWMRPSLVVCVTSIFIIKPYPLHTDYRPFHPQPRVVSVDVSVFMQKERIMPLLLSTVASRWNCGDLWLFGLSSSVSWYLLPMSQWNPFASGHPDAAFGIPYVPAGQ